METEIKFKRKKDGTLKRLTKAERDAIGLDKVPNNRYGEQVGRNPRLHEYPHEEQQS